MQHGSRNVTQCEGARIRISGVGAEIPARVVTTAEVEERAKIHEFGLEPGWLERVTGVRERRWAEPQVQPSELAARASEKALADAGAEARELDAVLFCGITRDCLEPATANLVAESIGAGRARVFDLINACNSLIDGIDVADSLIRSGKAQRVLVATGERASTAIRWRHHTLEELLHSVGAMVVGDGGGAVVVEPSPDPERGILEREFRSDATQWRHAIGGRFRTSDQTCERCGGLIDPHFTCDSKSLFAAAFGLLLPTMRAVMRRTGWSYGELDVVFCHQPTRRFVELAAGMLGPEREVVRKLWPLASRFGNMSTCSLPWGMSQAREAGVLVPGARTLVLAPSSGVSAAGLTLVW
jgi:3-oxoacyl-(acyl-carrier-protein) synthase III